MCRKLLFLALVIGLFAPATWAASITVVNYSFEIPQDGQKRDISVGTPGVVTGWARTNSTTSAGREYGWTPTEGTATAFMGKDAEIFNLTDFLLMDGDTLQLTFDARSTYHGDNLAAQLYYKDNAGNRVVFAITNIDLWNKSTMATYTLDSNAVGLAGRDHKLGIQFKQTRVKSTDDNLWCGLDYIRLSITTPLMRAQTPYPAYESFYIGDSVTLTWVPGPDTGSVDNYRVYFSNNWADVNSGAPAANKGLTGGAASYLVSSLAKGIVYYWRIDTVIGANTYRGNIWKFTTKPVIAYDPNPDTGAEYVPVGPVYSGQISPVLSWTAGSGAVLGHRVYFSTSFNDVNNAPVGSTALPFRKYISDINDTNWAPVESGLIPLTTSKTYYWRIDEVQSTSPQTIYKGTVWSFTTVPVPGLGSILCQLYTGITGGTVADLTNSANYPDDPNVIEFFTSFEAPHRAFVEYGSRVHGYLYIRNTGDYTFWIASGENSQLWLSPNEYPGNASIIASVEGGDGYTDPRQWDKYPDIQQSDPVHLEAGKKYYLMVLHKKGWGYDNLAVAWQGPDQPNPPVNGDGGAIIPGISLIPFDPSQQLWAYDPKPGNGATNVETTLTLSWTPGTQAAKHDVYFSDNWNDVNEAKSSDPNGPGYVYKGRIDPCQYNITSPLTWGQTYYWRIDEVNDVNIWRGNIWSFTVRNYVALDDFESYNNSVSNTWIKGGGGTVGYSDPNKEELTIVHGGNKSMPFDYNNTSSAYSEATRTFATDQNWVAYKADPNHTYSLKALQLWFRGYPALIGNFVENPAGIYTMAASGMDINTPNWRFPSKRRDEFHYAYTQVNYECDIIAKVDSLSSNADSQAKAGLMIRDSLADDSAYVMMCITPGSGIWYQYRPTAGQLQNSGRVTRSGLTAPHWLWLRREFNGSDYEWSGYYSAKSEPNQYDWTPLVSDGNIPVTAHSSVDTVYIGLIATARNATATFRAVFSNVSITDGGLGSMFNNWPTRANPVTLPSPWTSHQDIGIKSNNAAPLYVTLQDSTNAKKTVTHPDPNVVLSTSWQEWNIALSDFTGVDKTKIKKMTIGVGSNSPPVGTLYFDDIRLYLTRCMPGLRAPDFTGSDCLVDYQDLQILTNNWLISNYQVTPTAPSDANLVAYYRFEGNFNDSSIKGNHGEPNGATIVTDPIRGQVASFDGVNDCVNTNKTLLDNLSAFTLAGWVIAGNPQDSRTGLFGQNDAIEFGFDGGINIWTSGGGSTSTTWTLGTTTWHHVAVVGDGKGVKLYIDGVQLASGGSATSNYGTSTYPVNIGGGGVWDTSGNWFAGRMDDVRIYSRALSPGEIAYLAGKTTPFTQPLSGLLIPQNSAINLYNDGRIDLKDYAIFANTWLEVLLWP